MDTVNESNRGELVNLFPNRPKNKEIIELLKEALHAAERGDVSTVGIAYISKEGQIIIGSEGNAVYNTALMGGLMSLSVSLGQVT